MREPPGFRASRFKMDFFFLVSPPPRRVGHQDTLSAAGRVFESEFEGGYRRLNSFAWRGGRHRKIRRRSFVMSRTILTSGARAPPSRPFLGAGVNTRSPFLPSILFTSPLQSYYYVGVWLSVCPALVHPLPTLLHFAPSPVLLLLTSFFPPPLLPLRFSS